MLPWVLCCCQYEELFLNVGEVFLQFIHCGVGFDFGGMYVLQVSFLTTGSSYVKMFYFPNYMFSASTGDWFLFSGLQRHWCTAGSNKANQR